MARSALCVLARRGEDRRRVRSPDSGGTQTYGSYPRYRLLVTYFIAKKGWSVEQLFKTRLSMNEALAIMRADEKRDKLTPGIAIGIVRSNGHLAAASMYL
jgi:hypothetical protein